MPVWLKVLQSILSCCSKAVCICKMILSVLEQKHPEIKSEWSGKSKGAMEISTIYQLMWLISQCIMELLYKTHIYGYARVMCSGESNHIFIMFNNALCCAVWADWPRWPFTDWSWVFALWGIHIGYVSRAASQLAPVSDHCNIAATERKGERRRWACIHLKSAAKLVM